MDSTHSAVAAAPCWPGWLCNAGALSSQLRPLAEMPFFRKTSQEETPASAVAEVNEKEDVFSTQDDEDDQDTPRSTVVAAKLAETFDNTAREKLASDNFLEGCVALGKVKQKNADLHWWVPGVHQLVLWMGTARTGKGSGKGTGKGTVSAVAGAKGKSKPKGDPRPPE